MLKIVLFIIMVTNSLYGGWVSKEQMLNILDFNIVVEKVIAKDSEEYSKFRRYLFGMYFRESSFGRYSYSDHEEDNYYYLHEDERVYVSLEEYETASRFEGSGNRYIEVEYYGKSWKKRLYVVEGMLKPVTEASIGPLMMRVPTVRRLIKHYKLTKYYKYLSDDKGVVNELLNNMEFSVYLTVLYLKMNYDTAVSRGYSKPLLRAVGMHNGGWNNWTYVKKVEDGIQYTIKALEDNIHNIDGRRYYQSSSYR